MKQKPPVLVVSPSGHVVVVLLLPLSRVDRLLLPSSLSVITVSPRHSITLSSLGELSPIVARNGNKHPFSGAISVADIVPPQYMFATDANTCAIADPATVYRNIFWLGASMSSHTSA